MKRKTKNSLMLAVIATGAVAAAAATATFFIGNAVFNKTVKRREFNIDNVSSEFRRASRVWIDWWYKQPLEKHRVSSFDNLSLNGYLLKAKRKTNKVAVVVHGHECVSGSLGNISNFYYETMGYNVFAPDLRGHGESEGKCYGMSILDSEDLVVWLKYLVTLFGEQVEFVLHGLSMGAASSMIACAKPDAPKNLKCLVEDCGFSDGNELFSYTIAKEYPIIPKSFLTMSIASIMQLRGKYTLADDSAVESMKQATLPTLFIHGTADALVPVSMAHKLYDAKIGEKQKLVVEGAEHGVSYYKDTKLFVETLKGFLEKYFN